ncbi:hypothetical protein [Thermasporomyces composti]|uniref:DUF1542 domain-containing protein n=1 Tax=Thermasporomyces composti TaxID=696763 RepID=A0A3D9VBC1_THECX|nr:hypothetical protein [Thermasporomyces composti]REF37460.1 hypothetical protein DFJ64_2904 [Thermasporomyces composti]
MSIVLLVLIATVVVVAVVAQQRAQTRRRQLEAAELEKVKAFAAEDVTKFGEELQRLDVDVAGRELDEATRQDYERALDEYDSAKKAIDTAQRPEDIKQIASILEDGRYAVACVRARINGQPLPQRRPPCFFNPQHGPSTEDVEWAPPGGAYRRVPVCPADAERVRAGAEPDIRKVTTVDGERVPYWQGGPAYAPWMQGYFAGYATSALLPAFLMTSMMGGAWGGYGDGGYADADAGDAGGDVDAGGDLGGDDFGGGDFGGDFGGGDFGF